jgi:hypothetical protein
MYDKILVAIAKLDNNNEQYYELQKNIPTEFIPLGMFKSSNIESGQRIGDWLRKRCFPEDRIGAKELLDEWSIDRYDPRQIIKITRASMVEDGWWIKTNDADTYEKNTIRGQLGITPETI